MSFGEIIPPGREGGRPVRKTTLFIPKDVSMSVEQYREELELFVSLIMDKCGMRFTRTRLVRMKKAIERRMKERGVGSIMDYYQSITRGADASRELEQLFSEIVRRDDVFFAKTKPLEHAVAHAERIIAGAGSRNGKPLVKVWFPACGAGQEPYTFAMMLKEKLDPGFVRYVDILATDIDRESLAQACEGIYPPSSLEGVGEERRGRFFSSAGGGREKVDDDFRSMVSFGILDLAGGIYPSMLNGTSGLDIIVLRGILTYFNWKITERIASKFNECLTEGGLLFIGKGEKIPPMAGWEPVAGDGQRYYRKTARSAHVQGNGTSPLLPSLKDVLSRGGYGSGVPEKKTRNLFAERAYEYLSAGQTRKALITLTEAISSGSDDAQIHLRLADLYASRNDLAHAAEQCRRSLDLDPSCADAHILQGIIQMREGKYRESVESLKKALFVDPKNQEIRLHVARTLEGMGRTSAARKVYTKIVDEGKQDPNDVIFEVARRAVDNSSPN